LEIRGREADDSGKLKAAQAVAAYASAINSLAQADKAVGDQHLGWLDKVLKAHEMEFDAAMTPTKGADGSSKPSERRRRRLTWRIRSCRGNPNNIQPQISEADNMQGSAPGRDPDAKPQDGSG
jgi:hypothetical protein